MASQLLVDLYDCEDEVLNNLSKLRQIAHDSIQEINSDIVEECVHQFEPQGITYIAVITTSHFSIHTWPEYGYAAVDVFSCDEEIPDLLVESLQRAFGAKEKVVKKVERQIERRR